MTLFQSSSTVVAGLTPKGAGHSLCVRERVLGWTSAYSSIRHCHILNFHLHIPSSTKHGQAPPSITVKQSKKPVEVSLGNLSKGTITCQSDCRRGLSCAVYWQQRLRWLSKALAVDQELLSGGFMGKDQENWTTVLWQRLRPYVNTTREFVHDCTESTNMCLNID